jgi:hypothetical protein
MAFFVQFCPVSSVGGLNQTAVFQKVSLKQQLTVI